MGAVIGCSAKRPIFKKMFSPVTGYNYLTRTTPFNLLLVVQQRCHMSGPKRWVSSRLHRKPSSKGSLGSNYSSSPTEDLRRTPPSPPSHISLERGDSATSATSIVDFGSHSCSTFATQRGADGPVGLGSGGDPSSGSNSSLDSSPSATPPKKTWEMNYKSFLKSRLRQANSGKPAASTASHSATGAQHHTDATKSSNLTVSQGNVTGHVLPKSHPPQHMLFSSPTNEDCFGTGLADGFGDHSGRVPPARSATTAKGRNPSQQAAPAAADHGHKQTLGPSSPSKHKESSTRGGSFFQRMRSKTKSSDNLDISRKRGADRKSPVASPPGSASSTPAGVRPPLSPSSALQEGIEKAALLSDYLAPPALAGAGQTEATLFPKQLPRRVQSQIGFSDDGLDQARHRGYRHTSFHPPLHFSQSQQGQDQEPHRPRPYPATGRVKSMSSDSNPNLIIPEEEPLAAGPCRQEAHLARERRKAFTDFHNQGVDSSSAYLGDEPSLHRNSAFLSSMAYPAGSAGGKGKRVLETEGSPWSGR